MKAHLPCRIKQPRMSSFITEAARDILMKETVGERLCDGASALLQKGPKARVECVPGRHSGTCLSAPWQQVPDQGTAGWQWVS